MDALTRAITTRAMLMRDADGRPLSEAKAGADRMAGVPFELRRCGYPGSRHHHAHPMNVSALRQVSAHWEDLLGALAYLHALHVRWAGMPPTRLVDIWRIGHMTSAIAEYAFARARDPICDGALPGAIGAMYKVTLGVTSTCVRIWSDGGCQFSDPSDAKLLAHYAEHHGQLIGPEQVCGGSDAMILELLEIAVRGGPVGRGGALAANIVGDDAAFERFCAATAQLRLLRFVFDRIDATLRAPLAALAEAAVVDPVSPAGRFVNLDPAAQLAMIDDALAQLCDPRWCAERMDDGVRTLRASWLDEKPEHELAELAPRLQDHTQTIRCHAARYLAVERAAAPLVRTLKRSVARSLRITEDSAEAGALGLVAFEPGREGRPGMRQALRQLGISIEAPGGFIIVR
jgi:hypothetical protein